MAINDIVQTIADARVDARSLSDFVFKPAGFKVPRRLAPPIDTLQFYIDRFDATKATTDAYVATIPTIVNDAINNTAVEGGVLAATFVTVEEQIEGEGAINLRALNQRTAMTVESIADLSKVVRFSGRVVLVKNYDVNKALGGIGGRFIYDPEIPRTNHDGFFVISPTVPSIATQSGVDADYKLVNYMMGVGDTAAASLGAYKRQGYTVLEATDFPATTLSRKINNAIRFVTNGTRIPKTVYVTPKNSSNSDPNGTMVYDWDTNVDLSFNSGISLIGRGTVYVRATNAIGSFVQLGISNKNNQSIVKGFSFDCGNQNLDAAIIMGSVRGVKVSGIELKAGTGKFQHGILFGSDEYHTGVESGAGNERCSVDGLHDSGDSSVVGDMIHFTGGTSYGVTVNDVRATRENWKHIIGSSTTSGFSGCEFKNLMAVFLTPRPTKALSAVTLQRMVRDTKVENISFIGSGTADVECGVVVKNLAVLSSGLFINNIGNSYTVKDVQLDGGSNLISAYINGVAYNKGDPNTQGQMSIVSARRFSGGVIRDSVNNTIYVGSEDFSENGYSTPLFRRKNAIANDSVLKITFPPTDTRCTHSIVSVICEMSAGKVYAGIAALRFAGSSVAAKMSASDDFDVTTGILTGSTGVVGRVTISANAADNSVYVENRTGAARNFNVTFISG